MVTVNRLVLVLLVSMVIMLYDELSVNIFSIDSKFNSLPPTFWFMAILSWKVERERFLYVSVLFCWP